VKIKIMKIKKPIIRRVKRRRRRRKRSGKDSL
jgi:hypothetical protein